MQEVRPIDANALFLKQKSHADLFKGSGIHDDILSEYGEYQETVDVDVIAWVPMPYAYEPPAKE